MTFSSTQSPEDPCLQPEVWLQPALLYPFCSEAVWAGHSQLCTGDISNSCSSSVCMASISTVSPAKAVLMHGNFNGALRGQCCSNEKNMSLINFNKMKILRYVRIHKLLYKRPLNFLLSFLLLFVLNCICHVQYHKLRFDQLNSSLTEKLLNLHG